MEWLREPSDWQEQDNDLTFTVEPRSDFWRKTHNGEIRDNGHFRYRSVTGDFVAEVMVTGAYRAQYDQAGIMVRLDEATWMKCGIEYVDGVQNASAVVTRDYSDWSVVPLKPNPESIFLRVLRKGGDIEVFYSLDGENYTMIRTARLTAEASLQVGLMAVAPQGDGFDVTFTGFACGAVGFDCQ